MTDDGSAPRQRLGPYVVEGELGAGAMGVVYRAHDPRLDRRVALKALPEHFADDEERLARFEREARMLAALHHPHVAALHGLEEHDGRLYLVMEYVEGEDLAARIARGSLDVEESLELAEQIARGLAAAHDAGIIHRDLKPGNVLVTPDGRAKVVDFGLAKDVAPRPGGETAAPRSDEITRLSRAASRPSEAPEATTGSESAGDTVVQARGEPQSAGSELSVGPTVLAPDSASSDPVATEPGAILGTAAYMSPEQARGRPLDRRTDVWSFGCVLFEMLTRRRPFQGVNLATTITAVLQSEPDWELLPERTPPPVRRLLGRCLRKDPRERLRDLGDAALELRELRSGTWSSAEWSATDWPLAAAGGTGSARRRLGVALALLLGAAILGLALFGPPRFGAPPPDVQARLEIPLEEALFVGEAGSVALSPDGRHLAWVASNAASGNWRVYVRPLDGFGSRLLEGTEGASGIAFSPDGRWLAFYVPQENALKKVPVSGTSGVVVLSRTTPGGSKGLTWVDDETLVISYGFDGGLARISAAGGEIEPLTETGSEVKTHRYPHALPGGRHVLYTASDVDVDAFSAARLEIVDLETGDTRVVLEGGSDAVFVAAGGGHAPEAGDGWLLFVRDGGILSVPFDLDRLEVVGTPRRAFEPVLTSDLSGFGFYSAAPVAGREVLAFAPGSDHYEMNHLVVRTPDGSRRVLEVPERPYRSLRVSPEGDRALLEIDSATGDLWTYDFERRIFSRMTTRWDNLVPAWTPDGRVVYSSNRDGDESILYLQSPESAAEPELFRANPGNAESWTPDGEWLVVSVALPDTAFDLFALPAGGGEPRVLVQTPAVELAGAVSKGGWLVYASNETGIYELYLRPFDRPSPRLQVTNGGAIDPVFSADGRRIYFRRGARILAVSFDPTTEALGREELIWDDVDLPTGGPPSRKWDLLPDGSLLYPEPVFDPSEVDTLRVVLGFRDELAAGSGDD